MQNKPAIPDKKRTIKLDLGGTSTPVFERWNALTAEERVASRIRMWSHISHLGGKDGSPAFASGYPGQYPSDEKQEDD